MYYNKESKEFNEQCAYYCIEIVSTVMVSVYANRLLLWVQICDATECFVNLLPMGQVIVLYISYTKQLGHISTLEHCKRQ